MAALAFVVATVGTLLLAVSPARADAPSAEAQFFAATNRVRAAHGLAALRPSSMLTTVARRWSSNLASSWRLAHNMNLPNEVPADAWLKLGENVGTGSTVPSIQGAFEASPTHFENIVDPEWQQLGVGVVEIRGRIFVTLDFMRPAAAGAPARQSGSRLIRQSATGATAMQIDAVPASSSTPAPAAALANDAPATAADPVDAIQPPTPTSALVLGASLEQVRGIEPSATAAPASQRVASPGWATELPMGSLGGILLAGGAAIALFAATRRRRVAEQFARN